MTRLIFILFSIVFLTSCKSNKETAQLTNNSTLPVNAVDLSKLRDHYRVLNIDSVDNIFVVYAKKDSLLYKIVSSKGNNISCERIRIGMEYAFVLHSVAPQKFKDMDISRQSNLLITGIGFNGTTVTFEEKYQNDIFISTNMTGLCLQ